MIYQKYTNALTEKRFWKALGFHSVIISKSSGWKVKIIGFVGFKGVNSNG